MRYSANKIENRRTNGGIKAGLRAQKKKKSIDEVTEHIRQMDGQKFLQKTSKNGIMR